MAYLEIIYPSSDSWQLNDVPESVILHSDDTCKIGDDSLEEEVNRMTDDGLYDFDWKDGLVSFTVKDCTICNQKGTPFRDTSDLPKFLDNL